MFGLTFQRFQHFLQTLQLPQMLQMAHTPQPPHIGHRFECSFKKARIHSVLQRPSAPYSATLRHTTPYSALQRQKKLNRPTKQRSIQLKNKFFKDLEVVQSVVEGDVLSHLTHHLIVTGSLSVLHPGTKDVAHDSAEVLVPWI